MEQLILHLLGDYILQSDWMATGKTGKYGPALAHATVYSLPFLLLRPSWVAFSVILGTHFIIDRFRLAKYVVYAKNFLAPPSAYLDSVDLQAPAYRDKVTAWKLKSEYLWQNCSATGYYGAIVPWLTTWLMIIADNTMHLAINYLSLKYL